MALSSSAKPTRAGAWRAYVTESSTSVIGYSSLELQYSGDEALRLQPTRSSTLTYVRAIAYRNLEI
jgi:hypothetical protein